MDELLQYLNSIHPLSDELKNHLKQIIQIQEVSKKEYLLELGRVCKGISFVAKGLVRCFYYKNGREVCSWFMKEGDLIVSVESFFSQVPSYENMQALEDCLLFSISYDQLQHIYLHYPEFNYIGRVLTEKYYILCDQRLYSLRMQKAAERYEYLIQNQPEIIQRVPAQYIASYLGITSETLSRIRKVKK